MKIWEFFQWAADLIKKDVPEWITNLVTVIGNLLVSVLSGVTQAYIQQIEDKIVAIDAQYPDASGEEKFNLVWDFAHVLLPALKEWKLDLIIQNIFSNLKEAGLV